LRLAHLEEHCGVNVHTDQHHARIVLRSVARIASFRIAEMHVLRLIRRAAEPTV
jgi:hypothetical protein